MSTFAIVTIVAVGGILGLSLIGELPNIIRALADLRLSATAEGLYNRDELAAAILVAIERTDADVGTELAERLALTVIEDLEDGVIGAELRTPPE